ncbi:VOC family protein [Candidatus Micrarchaeota archaeon]|nr:VOC family protein [Candidatus Micrarchaeota archaeon]
MKLNPYLNFGNKTEQAFLFYKSVFGSEFSMIQKFKEAPGDFPDSDKEKIMHVALPVGNSTLMGSDTPESMMNNYKMGTNVSLSLEPDSKEQATELFNKLSAGGMVTMPLADQFWGAWFGMCVDKFGIHWMVNYTYKK